MKWYQHDPEAFNFGTAQLTLEETGAYILILNMLYSRDGDLADDDELIARVIHVQIRTWRKVKVRLIAKGKIWVTADGKLMGRRVENTLKSAQTFSENQAKRASKGWEKRKNPSECNANEMPSSASFRHMPSTLNKDIESLLPSSVTTSEQAPGSLATAPLESALAPPACEKPKGISGKSLTAAAIAPETDPEKAARREAYLKHKAAQAERDRQADEAAKAELELMRKNTAAGGHTARALADMAARKAARLAFEELEKPHKEVAN